jgi:hypothetical protein
VKRIALLVPLVLLALLAAGCGAAASDSDDENRQEPQTISAGQVIPRFERAPGQPKLKQAPGADAAWEQLSFGFDVPPALQRRYGTFSVYVVEPGNNEAVESLLRDKEDGKLLERGPGGIYWEHDDLADTYVAYKRFGANAVLVWWSEKPRPETDARWQRLDGMLTSLART